jgi:hypothetical protein
LFTDQIHTGDQFGDRMLDLDAGVHLDEVEIPVLEQELEGAGTTVADAIAGFHAHLADGGALFRRDAGRRRFLDHLLVAALHGAVAFGQMDGVALAVSQYLDLHVARILQKFLHVHLIVAERRARFRTRGGDGVAQMRLGVHHAHAAPAAAAGGLDDDRIADLAGDGHVLVHVIVERTAGTGHARDSGILHGADGLDLVAHQADGLGLRPDEHKAGLLHLFGEVGVLGQETIARMDRAGVGDLGCGDDGRDVEVTQRTGPRADADGLVGHADMLEVAVGGRMHGHGPNAHRMTGAQDAQGDFAAVGDEDFV